MAARGVEFESVNVQDDPGGMELLQSLGAKTVPVVSVGKKWVFTQTFDDVSKLLGIDFDDTPQLSPDELAEKVKMIIAGAERFVRQLPAEQFDQNVRNRKRKFKDLCFHIFRLTEAFLDVVIDSDDKLTREFMNIPCPDHLKSFDDIADYGNSVGKRFSKWWDTKGDVDFSRIVPTYYGDKELHYVFERLTWHPGQHARQLVMLLRDDFGIEPNQPLEDSDFAGLPIPEKAWDGEND